MNPSGGDGGARRDQRRALNDSPVLFTPMTKDGASWLRITEPQPDPRVACMTVAALIHLLQPGIPLSELQGRAEASVRALEEGAASVTVIDDMHRVDRAVFHPRHSLS